MLHILAFDIIQLTACAYALLRGGRPERLAAIMMLIAAAATEALPTTPRISFHSLEIGESIIDGLLFVCFYLLAVRAQRFWPMWVASLQLLAIGIHGVRAYDAGILPIVYARALGEISYPMIALLVIGTYRHIKRTNIHGSEPDWSPIIII